MSFWPPQNPAYLIGNLQDEVNRLVERVWHAGVSTRPFDGQEWAPTIDLIDQAEQYVAYVEVPGIEPGEVDVTHAGSVLTIRGTKRSPVASLPHGGPLRSERRFGSFCRMIELPADSDTGQLSAKYQSGVLVITIPKSASARPKSVKIDVKNT